METGGKMSNTEKSFHRHQKSPEEQTTSLSSLPHLKEPEGTWRSHSSPRLKHSYNKRDEKPGDASRNSSSFSGGAAKETSHDGRHREKALYDPRAKASKKNIQGFTQGRINGRNSADAQVKGDRGPRVTPNSARRPKPEHTNMTHFEVKMADFPELGGMPSARPDVKFVQKDSWRQNPSPVSPHTPLWKTNKEGPPPADPRVTDTNSDSPDVTPGHPTVTSWANVASQPPKKQKETRIGNDQQQEEMAAHQEEGVMGKKKRRKKKKKPKDANEDAEAEEEEYSTHQEPPKFEDEEEFPGLNTTGFCEVTSRSYASKLHNKETMKDGPTHQSVDQLKDKSCLKSQTSEMNKKAQKTEKTSGKKSKAPVQLDIGNMLAVLEETHKSQKAKQDVKSVISVGGGLPFIPKQPQVQKKLPWQQEKIAHNPLDSTSPLVKKGKQREVPKAKKPTPLKKIILKEREERKQRRLLEEQGLLPETESVQVTEAGEEEQSTTNSADEETGTVVQEETLADDTNNDDAESHKEESAEQQTTLTITDSALKPKIHSRKFRDYCSQMLSKEVDECVTTLLKELVRFQDRLHQKDPIKARMKRRIVMGLREVLKHLKLRKVKCVIISPNCERVQSKGGLDEALHTIINTCREQEVPFIFALSRKALGRCLNKVVPVSLVGIFNYDGAQDHYHKMIELSSEARKAYEGMVCSLEQGEHEEAEDWQTELNATKQNFTVCSDASLAPPEEPEYIKMWKALLKDCNHKVLDFQSRLVDSGSECHLDDDEPS